jgi:hypothetical protein
MGTSKLIDSSAAFLFEVPGSNSPLVVQELQIGGTRMMAAIARLSFMVWQLCSWLCSITNKPSRQGGLMSHEAHPKSAHLLSPPPADGA